MSAHASISDITPHESRGDAALPAGWQRGDTPRVSTTAVPSCPVCEADSPIAFAYGYDYELETCSNRWKMVTCEDCSHVWLNPRPAIESLATIYPPNYYAYNYDDQVSPIAIKAKQWLDRMKMTGIFKALPAQPKSFIDIGCGNGRLLEAVHQTGVAQEKCFGLELDAAVVNRLKKQGFSAFCERVEACTQVPERGIDLATMFHVIEHVDNPGAVIDRIAEWLTDDGILAMETPNIESLDAKLGRRTFWGGYHFPRHWNLFTPASITKLLEQHGMEVIDIRYQSGHSFWIYGLHHKLRYGPTRWPRLAKLCNPFRNLPLLAVVTAFDRLRAKLGMKTSAMLVIARKRKSI